LDPEILKDLAMEAGFSHFEAIPLTKLVFYRLTV
jgi:hypothetical protein